MSATKTRKNPCSGSFPLMNANPLTTLKRLKSLIPKEIILNISLVINSSTSHLLQYK